MWCGHAASALNPVIEAVTDNKCLDILAQSAGQCKCFLILFFAEKSFIICAKGKSLNNTPKCA